MNRPVWTNSNLAYCIERKRERQGRDRLHQGLLVRGLFVIIVKPTLLYPAGPRRPINRNASLCSEEMERGCYAHRKQGGVLSLPEIWCFVQKAFISSMQKSIGRWGRIIALTCNSSRAYVWLTSRDEGNYTLCQWLSASCASVFLSVRSSFCLSVILSVWLFFVDRLVCDRFLDMRSNHFHFVINAWSCL